MPRNKLNRRYRGDTRIDPGVKRTCFLGADEIAGILVLYVFGETTGFIGKLYGIRPTTIYHHVNRYGLRRNRRGRRDPLRVWNLAAGYEQKTIYEDCKNSSVEWIAKR